MAKRKRIFLGLKEIAGFYASLEQGLQSIGEDAEFFDLVGHRFQYGSPPRRRFVRLAQWTSNRRNQTPRTQRLRKLWWVAFDQALRIPLLVWALWRFDVFIFGFKSSFIPGFHDLPLLKLFGKRIIYTFHGSDSRPPYVDGSDMASTNGLSIDDCIALAARKKAELRRIERYADILICHPPYGQLHERKFITCLTMGNPVRPKAEAPAPDNRVVRILHSPSLPEGKGTAAIRDAIERLRAAGYDVDYAEVVGQPNAVVVQEIIRCDFVVDQLYSDAPLASFATEAAFLGRPAVIGGYITPEDLGVPPERIAPCELCHPDDVQATIERLIRDVDERHASAHRTRSFVTQNWAPDQVARRFLRLVENDIPEDWWFDPHQITYVHGALVSEERGRQLVRSVIERGGAAALQLDDKPALRDRFIAWSNGA